MKKKASILLALTLALSINGAALAAGKYSATSTGEAATIEVNGTYKADEGSTVISVDIAWGAMKFTYNAETKGTWKPATHTYEGGTAAGWTEEGNVIAVTNHSNVDVKAGFTFNAALTNLSASFAGTSTVGKAVMADNSVTLKAGVENQPDSADKVDATLTMTGSLPEKTDSVIGEVMVSIEKAGNGNVVIDSGWEGGFDVNF